MSEEQLEYDPEWTLATLNDAKEALEDLIAQVEDSPEEVKEILEENIANVYAKLNYAFNSAKDGPDALLSMPDDELVEFSHARERCSHRCERLKNLVVH